MNDFVIVIEVSPERARRAYAAGLEALDRAMPALMAGAERHDAESDLREQKRKKAENEQRDRFDKYMNQNVCFTPVNGFFTSVMGLNKRRKRLTELLDIANIAMANYKMSEHQVKDMLQWEDGTEVSYLHEIYCDGKGITLNF